MHAGGILRGGSYLPLRGASMLPVDGPMSLLRSCALWGSVWVGLGLDWMGWDAVARGDGMRVCFICFSLDILTGCLQ